jgi:UDP-N-acetylglucosamine--N-acetylmuramyl-(pentapeptide) pyrophosphoryl-undecaprenol N-acetylglucosamine transferase
MPEPRESAFLIATGGTAGHVLPALAVAEALRGRGARVTFAGSPARAEARLVPEAGFELDTFRVSGLPRRPGLAQAHALRQPARGSWRGAGPMSSWAAEGT